MLSTRKRVLILIPAAAAVCIVVLATAILSRPTTINDGSIDTETTVAGNEDDQHSESVADDFSVKVTRERKDTSTEIPDDIRQRVVSDFGQQRAEEVYRYLLERIPTGLANGTRPRHLRCILYLAKGDMEQLDRYIEMCLTDTRDVMLHAEYEKAEDPKLKRKRDFSKPFDQAQIQTD